MLLILLLFGLRLKKEESLFGVLLGLALCVVGCLNPALFLGALECAVFGFGGGLAAGAVAGAIGFGVGTALGASADAVYASLGKGVGRKKLLLEVLLQKW